VGKGAKSQQISWRKQTTKKTKKLWMTSSNTGGHATHKGKKRKKKRVRTWFRQEHEGQNQAHGAGEGGELAWEENKNQNTLWAKRTKEKLHGVWWSQTNENRNKKGILSGIGFMRDIRMFWPKGQLSAPEDWTPQPSTQMRKTKPGETQNKNKKKKVKAETENTKRPATRMQAKDSRLPQTGDGLLEIQLIKQGIQTENKQSTTIVKKT